MESGRSVAQSGEERGQHHPNFVLWDIAVRDGLTAREIEDKSRATEGAEGCP
jgi:hypothetical protein